MVGGSTPADHDGWMWDLTIPGDHDFYIDTAVAAVLVHNCSAFPERTAYLYRLEDIDGNYLKTGMSEYPKGRYRAGFMRDKVMRILTSGPKSEIRNLERYIVEIDPGPLNKEPWAGARVGE